MHFKKGTRMALTKRQLEVLKSEAMIELKSIRIDLHYSLGLLVDYKEDLKTEMAGMTKSISKGKKKLKALEDKIISNGGTLLKLKRDL